jgi:hypothetical protein
MGRRQGWKMSRSRLHERCSYCELWVNISWMSRHLDAGCAARVAVNIGTNWNATHTVAPERLMPSIEELNRDGWHVQNKSGGKEHGKVRRPSASH